MANSFRWNGHVMRRTLDFEVEGQRKRRRPKRTWKTLVGEECVKVGVRMDDALLKSKWSVVANQISAELR